MSKFRATIEIIGINPFVFVPDKILSAIFKQASKDKGPIPIKGTLNGQVYKQTLVKFKSDWRLYINTTMLKNSPKRVGELVLITVEFDPSERIIKPHPRLVKALIENPEARKIFDSLSASRRNEIARYLSFLKTEESISKNISRAINYLLGQGRFVGRSIPHTNK